MTGKDALRDKELLDALEEIEPVMFENIVWRVPARAAILANAAVLVAGGMMAHSMYSTQPRREMVLSLKGISISRKDNQSYRHESVDTRPWNH